MESDKNRLGMAREGAARPDHNERKKNSLCVVFAGEYFTYRRLNII